MWQMSLLGGQKQEAARRTLRRGVRHLASRCALRRAVYALCGAGVIAAMIWINQPGTLADVGDDIRAGFESATAVAGMSVQRIRSEGQHQTSNAAILASVGIAISARCSWRSISTPYATAFWRWTGSRVRLSSAACRRRSMCVSSSAPRWRSGSATSGW